MKRWFVGRQTVSLLLVGAVCLLLCAPFAMGAQRTPAEMLRSGGSFVLVAAYSAGEETCCYAMGTNPDRKLDAVPVTAETPEENLPVWTVQPVGDGVSLSVDGVFLGYGGDTYFACGEDPFVWQLVQGEDGTVRFCTETGQAIGYNDNEGDGRFGVYDLSEAWDSQYRFDLLAYPLSGGIPEETTQPTTPDPFPGGTGILWLKGQSVALSGKTDDRGYLTGTPVSENEGVVTGYGPADIWTVQPGTDGVVTLRHGGRVLSLPEEDGFPLWDGTHTGWEMILREDGIWQLRSASRPDCYLGWNPMLETWSAGNFSEISPEYYSFTFAPAQADVALPVASEVRFTPQGGELYPQGGASITLTTETPGGEIYYATSADGTAYGEFTPYTQPIRPETGFGNLWVMAYAAAPGYENSPETICRFTERTGYYGFYFGQLHAHTAASDGIGTAEEAFRHGAQVENLDFLGITDHSNSFDNDTLGSLSQDGTAISREWQAGKAAAEAVTDGFFVGLYGFEMTWNNGLGHISTFGTPGWASRNQSAYQDLGTALENYYEALATVPGSVSQFNHPGELHGDFENLAYHSPVADRAVTLTEVFNTDAGDAYDAYIRALDLGWHLAPTCSQDNHSGDWGSLDAGRTVVLANTLTERNLLDAMAHYRVYATQDSDLKIFYTLDGNLMGARLFDYGEAVTIQVSLSDATDGNNAVLEVIGSGGTVAATQNINGAATLTLPSDSPYYFLRIIQPDGDVAVTAPVWLEQEAPLEITGFAPEGSITVAEDTQTFTVEIANRTAALSGAVIRVTDQTGQLLASETMDTLPGESSTLWSFSCSFPRDGIYTLTLTVTAGGRTASRNLSLTVMPRSILSDVIVDGTHGASVAADNLIAVAEAAGFKAHVEKNQITAKQLESCSLLIIPAPCTDFGPEFIECVTCFSAGGGTVLLCGSSDEGNPGTAARMNGLLAALGSTMTLSDDTVYDPASNGGAPDVIFPATVNGNSPWTKGIREGQVYNHRAGCSVNIGGGIWLIRAMDSSFSVDGDFNGLEHSGETYREILLDDSDNPKEVTYHLVKSAGEVCLLAAEESAGGMVFLSGAGFPFDESMQLETESPWDLPYANRTVFANILGIPVREPQTAPIARVREGEEGRIFLVEGYVTAGTANPHNRLPETIYIQDCTGGIAAAPYAEEGLELGTKVRVTGVLRRVHGDTQLEILHSSVLEEPGKIIEPAVLDNGAAMDYPSSGGLLVQIRGTVNAVTPTADGLGAAEFTLVDEYGAEARVLVEDCIRSGTTGRNTLANIVQAGNEVSVIGLVYHPEETVLRVRNCDEVVLLWAPQQETSPTESNLPTESIPPTNGNPPTGDSFPLEALLAAMVVSLLSIGTLLKRKRA